MKLPAKLKMWALVNAQGELRAKPLDPQLPRIMSRKPATLADYKPVRVDVTIRPLKRGARG